MTGPPLGTAMPDADDAPGQHEKFRLLPMSRLLGKMSLSTAGRIRGTYHTLFINGK